MKKSFKKMIALGTTLAISLSIMGGTALVSANNVSGYEKFKQSAMKSAFDNTNFTKEADFSIYMDDVEVQSGNMVVKTESPYASSSKTKMKTGENAGKTVEYYSKDGDQYFNGGGDTYKHFYYPVESDDYAITETEKKLLNTVLDLVSGDVKNYFTLNENVITVDLSKNQIPDVMQLSLAVMSERLGEDYGMYYEDVSYEADPMFDSFLENYKNAYFEVANLTATLDDAGRIEAMQINVVIKGQDSSGTPHVLRATCDIKLYDFGSTTVEDFDIKDKKIIEEDLNEIAPHSVKISR